MGMGKEDQGRMNQTKRYQLSFTGASLALVESIKMAEVFLQCRDWASAREITISNNLLQSRTLARTKRLIQEIALRLSPLNDDQLTLLVEGDLEEQRLILWFAVCQYYLFIREFATEVLHEKFLGMQFLITESDYNAFYLRKMDFHPELGDIKESTRIKLRTQVFRMLREAGLINNNGQIIRVLPSARLIHALGDQKEFAGQIYPAFSRDFEE